jgi:hypothetical protein
MFFAKKRNIIGLTENETFNCIFGFQGLLRPIFGAPQTHNCCKLTFFAFVWIHNALINNAMHFFIRFSQGVQMIQADGEGRRRRRLGDASQVRGRSVAGGGKECCRSGAKVSFPDFG